MEKVKVAVIGASGYTGVELLRQLLMHPYVEISCVTSRQYEGRKLNEVFPRFLGASNADLCFTNPEVDEIVATGATTAFLALPHGVAATYASALVCRGVKVVDLSADFRISDPAVYEAVSYTHLTLPTTSRV